jgi:acetoin utilization protein AcuB
MLGATRAGVRLTVDLPDRKGILARVAGAISEAGANIISVATFELSPGTVRIVIRLEPENADKAAEAISACGFKVVHRVRSYVQ